MEIILVVEIHMVIISVVKIHNNNLGIKLYVNNEKKGPHQNISYTKLYAHANYNIPATARPIRSSELVP